MNQLSLNLVAISIFAMTLSVLLGPLLHIPSGVPAIATLGILGLATLDAFSWEGQGRNLLLDWLAGFSPSHRERVIRHEAGHFLTAQLLEIPVTDYSLSAWEAFRKGFGGQGGVQIDWATNQQPTSEGQPSELSVTRQDLDRLCTVWMAGIAAEKLVYSEAEGGLDDRFKLRETLRPLNLTVAELEQQERWASLRAKTLLETHWSAYEALVEALTNRSDVATCRSIVQTEIDKQISESVIA